LSSRGLILKEIRMTKKELNRIKVLILIEEGKLTIKKGSEALSLSIRQTHRLRRRYKEGGEKSLAHQARGRKSNRGLKEEIKDQLTGLLHQKYADFGPTLAAEKISKELKMSISREAIRRIQIEEGLWKPKRRKERKYHPRRCRRSKSGDLIQIDGSEHDWLEGRGNRMTLIIFIDDATSKIQVARFVDAETTSHYMSLTKDYIELYGLPKQAYSDKHSIFRHTNKKTRGEGKLTNFGQALKDLEIELICANSPQAKGRVERSFGTLQDRLVKEMRLANIETIEEANNFLRSYIKEHNRRFSVKPNEEEDGHRKLKESKEINKILSFRERRKVAKDLSFQYKNAMYQIVNPPYVNRLQNQTIELRETLDNELIVTTKEGRSLEVKRYNEYREEQKTVGYKELAVLWPDQAKRKPSRRHPWR